MVDKEYIPHSPERHTNEEYYKAFPALQPKREIAEYVASQGILTPGRFPSLEDALATGRPFVIRSEHPQDYDGASGILESLLVSPEEIERAQYGYSRYRSLFDTNAAITKDMLLSTLPELTQDAVEQKLTQLSRYERQQYCKLAGIDQSAFDQEISYTYWEAVSGTNWTIVADTSVSGRYHLFSRSSEEPYQNRHFVASDTEGTIDGNPLIAFYETVRALSRFDSANCPIVEVQQNNSGLYFLQYHKGADFSPTTFTLDRQPDQQEVAALFVRGATKPEGEIVTVGWYGFQNGSPQIGVHGAIDVTPSPATTEPWVRDRHLQILSMNASDAEGVACNGHTPRSMLMKPRVSVVLGHEDQYKLLAGVPFLSDAVPEFQVRVVSDGTTAYLSRYANA